MNDYNDKYINTVHYILYYTVFSREIHCHPQYFTVFITILEDLITEEKHGYQLNKDTKQQYMFAAIGMLVGEKHLC